LPTHEQAIRIRKLSSQGKLTPDIIAEIIAEEKTNQKMRIILKSERALSAIPAEIPISKQEEYIAKALEFYGKSRRK
jgi:ParB family chromosome partitioning protein